MKIKRILLSTLMAVSVFSFSQSAFAIDGYHDTKATAKVLSDSEQFGLALTSANDVDWLKWTNNTGASRYVNATLFIVDPDGSTNYDLAFTIEYPSGAESGPYYTYDTGPNGMDTINFLQIPPNATIYLKVSAKQFSPKSYTIMWHTQKY